MGALALLFIIVPIVELSLLVRLGGVLGGLPTIGLVIVTGVVGAALAKHQGMGVIRQVKAELGSGRLPTTALVDGAILLVAALLLITPGVLTDAVGLACLVPPIRALVRRAIWARVERAVQEQRVHVTTFGGPGFGGFGPGPGGPGAPGAGDGPVIDGESEPIETRPDRHLE